MNPIRGRAEPVEASTGLSEHESMSRFRGWVFGRTWITVAIASCATLLACHGNSPKLNPGSTAQIEGCWNIALAEEGAQRDSVRAWLPARTLPDILQLSSATRAPDDEENGPYSAYSWFDERRETEPFSVWNRFEGDSIRVQRAGALAGLMLRLTPERDELVGTVVSFSDISSLGTPARRQASVVASPVDCPRGN